VKKGLWKSRVRKNINEKDLGSCDRSQRRLQTSEGRIYPLSKTERDEVQNFVTNQLRKGYIRLLKFPQMLPVFFVRKKNRSKCMIMDYCGLNAQTIKNSYLLPLITDLINTMDNKKIFTKMDLQWDFNNVRIKEGNEWKGMFTMYIRPFELTVMFFGMTNSPAIFQTMINKILRDLINEGKVAVFVNNMLVETENKKGHDEIIEEVLRKATCMSSWKSIYGK